MTSKHSNYLRLSIVFAALVFYAGGCSSDKPVEVQETRQVTVRLSRPGVQKPGNHIFAPAYINGYRAGYFMVDSGASLTVIDLEFVDHMKLKATGEPTRNITGIGSRLKADHYWLSPLKIGDRDFGNVSAAAIDIEKFSHLKMTQMSGILGMDCLRRQPFTINYKQKYMTFHDPDDFQPPAGSKAYRFQYTRSGLMLIPVVLNGQYKAGLVLDTGASSSISLPRSALNHWPRLLSNKHNVQSQGMGVGSEFKTFSSKPDSIEIFGYTLSDVYLSIEDGIEKSDAHRVVIGRVGNFILENFVLTFDCSNQTIYAKWQPLQQ